MFLFVAQCPNAMRCEIVRSEGGSSGLPGLPFVPGMQSRPAAVGSVYAIGAATLALPLGSVLVPPLPASPSAFTGASFLRVGYADGCVRLMSFLPSDVNGSKVCVRSGRRVDGLLRVMRRACAVRYWVCSMASMLGLSLMPPSPTTASPL